ncbi:ATP-binding protein [Kineosporia babensis]|uniref:ATP-binding protein n=1 Tax=Kineosporia babensis TaxID=499548 RepID=A0A9X1NCS6_9ACTN|nr:ATP-binding protein [Kineosporia babensis]MCD5312592.1 ATP-binding protein [Kineosporia babensis]
MATTPMTDQERQALTALRLNWVVSPQHAWNAAVNYVPAIHNVAAGQILRGIEDARGSRQNSPLGLVVEGEGGTGKTHMLSWVREQVQGQDGFFFLVEQTTGATFWDNVVQALLDGLWRAYPGSELTQLQTLLTGLEQRTGPIARNFRHAVQGRRVTPTILNMFTSKLSSSLRLRPALVETARALTLYASERAEEQDIAKAYFLPTDELDAEVRAAWGLQIKQPAHTVAGLIFELLALVGHSVISFDQIDGPLTDLQGDDERKASAAAIATGLMDLQSRAQRSLVMVVCLPVTWRRMTEEIGQTTVGDRFRRSTLSVIRTPEIARAIAVAHVEPCLKSAGYEPASPIWPIAETAFDSAVHLTPRQLLQKIDQHAQDCLLTDTFSEMQNFKGSPALKPAPRKPKPSPLDQRFAELKAAAKVERALTRQYEDVAVPALLRSGIAAWFTENGFSGAEYSLTTPPSTKPLTHAGFKRVIDLDNDLQEHYSFRAISPDHAPLGALSRLRNAMTAAGLGNSGSRNQLIILRQGSWSAGPKTQEAVQQFQAAGGRQLTVSLEDLQVLDALGVMLKEQHPELPAWLAQRRPASNTSLFGTALKTLMPKSKTKTVRPSDDTAPIPVITPPPAALDPSGISFGRVKEDDSPISIDLESLRKHMAVFAGSGSGKTVLLRRVIEECAIAGVSAIVLDPNNDLARLGDAWPEPPAAWQPGDQERSQEYLANTDVVVWTPLRENGRPLTFQPLPDFTSVMDDADEFRLAIDVAVSTLAPRVRATASTAKAERQKAVLRQALEQFAKDGGGSLEAFIDLLAELPPYISTINKAADLAYDMAQSLTAAMVNDPLFGGGGTPVDPQVLLTPAAGKRARISVISFIGLPDDEQRQGFISQLQMALFAWFKRNPAGDRPLGGLLVMDEAQTVAPSGTLTPSTNSTLILASQARKYGLGLIFATQAPKGLHNRIPGNATTQLFGLLNSPSQIEAARGLARDKGGEVPDIGRLKSGQFYLAAEGTSFRLTQTFLCLSHHPRSPLTPDEVLERSRKKAG